MTDLDANTWESAASIVFAYDRDTSYNVKSLARFDRKLRRQNELLKVLRQDYSAATDTQREQLHELIGDSKFWLLGAYEIVRTLDQRYRERLGLNRTEKTPLTELKHKLERLRIPLAKQEPSRRNSETDYRYLHATLSNAGVGWKPSQDSNFLFSELSDELRLSLCSLPRQESLGAN